MSSSRKEESDRLNKNRSEVETARKTCSARIARDDHQLLKLGQAKGTVQIVDDPSLKDKKIGQSADGEVTLVHAECWKQMAHAAEIVEEVLPPEQLWLLNEKELGRFEGAVCALRWVLGEHNEALFSYLASDRFRG